MTATEQEQQSLITRACLERYSTLLLRQLVAHLIKPRNPVPEEEYIDRILTAITNPPVVDRRIRDLSTAARLLLCCIGRSGQNRWKVGHLLVMSVSLGHAEGIEPVRQLLNMGFLFPSLETALVPTEINEHETWMGETGFLDAWVYSPSFVSSRAKNEELPLPNLGRPLDEGVGLPEPLRSDGLEWILRLSVVSQLLQEAPVRLTQSRSLFKRDLARLQNHPVLSAAPTDEQAPLPDLGALSLYWALAGNWFEAHQDELRYKNVPAVSNGLMETLASLAKAMLLIENWDPILGCRVLENQQSAWPSVTMLLLLLLSVSPEEHWIAPVDLAHWLWEHHPSWQGQLPKETYQDHGTSWVHALLLGVFYPLRLIELQPGEVPLIRFSDLGRHLYCHAKLPDEVPALPQTLLIQPNAEIIAYRQGLTPMLITKLSRFAAWKTLGAACQLELNAEQTYRGLEAGMNLPDIIQTLNQHSTRAVPAPVIDLLQRWSNKRERISVYTNATIVEFQNTADLDQAISRGIVALRITDRLGLCSQGADPEFRQLRLVGNRDYFTKPSQCLDIADDGVTLTIDPVQADLLIETELQKVADMMPPDISGHLRYQFSPKSLQRCQQQGMTLEDLETWFESRTGRDLSPAIRMLFLANKMSSPKAAKRLVIHFADDVMALGLAQWPASAAYIQESLGSHAIVVDEQHLSDFQTVLRELGLELELS